MDMYANRRLIIYTYNLRWTQTEGSQLKTSTQTGGT